MKRQEFIDEVCYWYQLIDFCSDEGCDFCENIYSDEERDDAINEDLYEWVRNMTWREILDTLQGYDGDSGYDYYLKNDYGEFEGLNNYEDFTSYKDDVLDWGDDNDIWDEDDEDEDEDEEPQPYIDPEDTTPLETEDISIEELLSSNIITAKITDYDDSDIRKLLAV